MISIAVRSRCLPGDRPNPAVRGAVGLLSRQSRAFWIVGGATGRGRFVRELAVSGVEFDRLWRRSGCRAETVRADGAA